jgi:hypothetical protein
VLLLPAWLQQGRQRGVSTQDQAYGPHYGLIPDF